MALTDRQAADIRKEDAVSKAYQTFSHHKQSNRHQAALGFRNGLHEAVRELKIDLIAIYAELQGADEAPVRNDLIKVITDRVLAFIQSCLAGERGDHVGAALREAHNLTALVNIDVVRAFELAVHARMKQEALRGTATMTDRTSTGNGTAAYRAVILTALPLEFAAIRRHLIAAREDVHPSGTIYEVGEFAAEAGRWQVAVAEIGAGNEGASQHVERAATYFRPHVVFFVGVAGGIKDVALGDVVASTKVYAYHAGKDADSFQPRPEVAMASHALEQRARAVARGDAWLRRAERDPAQAPRAFVGPIAAGEVVVASTSGPIFERIRSTYGDALAVEMEGHGFLAAIRALRGIDGLVVRGISDLVAGKADADARGSQPEAARNASAFAFEVLARFTPFALEATRRE